MKKSILILAILGILMMISGYIIITSWEILTEWPISNNVVLSNILDASFDSDGNIYAIDNSKKRIVVADKKGIVTLKLASSDAQINTTCRFTDFVVDKDKNLFILKTVMNFSGTRILKEEIVEYPASVRTKPKVIARAVYGKPQGKYGHENPKTMKLIECGNNGELYYYAAQNSEVIRKTIPVKVDSGSLSDLAKEDKNDMKIPLNCNHANLVCISKCGEDSLVYSTKNGEIFHADSNGYAIKDNTGSGNNVTGFTLPVNVGADSSENIYYADVIKGEIRRINSSTGQNEVILSQSNIKKILDGANKKSVKAEDGEETKLADISLISNIQVSENGSVTAIISGRIFKAGHERKVETAPLSYKYSDRTIIYNWVVRAQPIVLIIIFIILCRFVFVVFLKKRISMAVKQSLKFTPVIVLAAVFIAGIVYVAYSNLHITELEDRMAVLVKIGTKEIDKDSFERIKKPSDYMSEDFKNVNDKINLIINENISGYESLNGGSAANKVLNAIKYVSQYDVDEIDGSSMNIYTQLYKISYEQGAERIYICMNDKNDTSIFYPLDAGEQDEYHKIAFSGSDRVSVSVSNNAEGVWLYALGAIKSGDRVIGIYETGMEMTGLIGQQKAMIMNILAQLAVIVLIIIAVFSFLMYRMTRPLRVLKKSFEEAASGNSEALIQLKTGDESEDLSEGFNKMFNKMSEKIRQRIEKITLIGESYSRFVPYQLRKLLNKEEITDVNLGDQSKLNMSIMFSNIRHFYSLSETMTTEENFNFINSFLSRIGPVIPQNSGFINKYLGAGIMALFQNKAEDALNAAIQMRSVLDAYNDHRLQVGYKKIDFGIGIHKCQVMMGIVGEEKRLEGTVIAEGVNLAETLEKITITFGASILVTSSVMDEISNKDRYQYRLLGRLILGDKNQPVTIYDVYQGDEVSLRKRKEETKDIFESGIDLYQKKNFKGAKKNFIEVIKQNNEDEAAKIYFFLSDKYLQQETPEDWDGTVRV
jgi:adenylate cyclase